MTSIRYKEGAAVGSICLWVGAGEGLHHWAVLRKSGLRRHEEETGKVCVLCMFSQSLVISMRYDVVTYECPTSSVPIGK